MEYPVLLSDKEIIYRSTRREEVQDKSGPCVYFLINGSEIIYVGQTFSLKNRLYAHSTLKSFTHVCFIDVERSELNNVEASYIVKLNPTDNRTAPSNDLYASTMSIRTRSMETLRSAIDRATEIITPSFQCTDNNPAKYFKISDIDMATAKIAVAIEESLSELADSVNKAEQ